MRSHRFWLVLLSVAILCASCSDKKSGRDDDQHAAADADGEFAMEHDDGEEGLRFSLREAEEPDEDAVRPRTVTGEPLGEQETATLLGRLPALPDEDEAQTEFAFRKRSKPAPRTGETVETAFPPEQQRELTEADDDAPFEVARYSPEGEIPLAPKLSVSFSKPVVAVTGQEDAAKTQPATIEPDVPGKWRWVGTRTALFEPEGERFPMATDYTVRVAEDLESARGVRLEEAVDWSFETPALEISRAYPSGQLHKRAPVLFLEFNQRVEPAELIDHIILRADGRELDVGLATDDQLAADDTVSRLVSRAREGHWIALRPEDDFPPATDVQLGLEKGAPSAEGPKRTESEQLESFRTYQKLRLERHNCTADRPCQPLASWYASFNNPLEEDAFSPDMIRIEPDLGDFEAEVSHSNIYIRGQAQPRTTYEVTFDAAIEDQLGQKLGEDLTREFHVGKAPPRLGSSAGVLTVLDPAANSRFPVFSVNHESMRVRAFEVEPGDWHDYLRYLQNRYRDESAQPPGKNVLDTEVDIDAEADQFTQTSVDLSEALDDDGHGQLVVVIEATEADDKASRRRGRHTVVSWVQGTDIALDAFASGERLTTWTSALADGAPLKDVEVSLLDTQKATTDASGLAELALPDKAPDQRGQVLVARHNDDTAILPESSSLWGGGRSNWVQRDVAPTVLWHVFDDRGIYKPGETVHIKGWARLSRVGQTPKLDAVPFERAKYQVRGPRGNSLAEGTTVLSDAGGFDVEIDLPDDVNLGSAHISLSPVNSEIQGQTGHSFQIQEFRRPEFEVDVTKQAGPHVVGQQTTLGAEASYYAGGGLAGAPVNWTVTSRTGQYTPPNRDDYIFGRWQPWWMPSVGGESRSESFSGHTDAAGKHHLEVSFDSARPPLPSVVEASSAVTDVNRQTWSADASMLVHPSQAYVGLRTERNFVERGEPFDVETIVADIDGDLVAQRPVEVSAMRLDWRMKNGKWQEVESDQTTCELTSADEAQSCTFTPEKGGTWRLRAVVRDERGRPNMTEMQVWVAGGQMPPKRRAEKQEVQLIPDKETYEAGDTAEILVQAPFADAEALLTIRQNGIVSKERFTIDGPSHTLEIPIEEAHYPNVHVQVDLVGQDARRDDQGREVEDAPSRPAFASGSLSLEVPPRKRVLDVAVEPAAEQLAPGSKTSIDVRVTDADGQPAAGSEVALFAVDEAILALTGYELRDPIDSFYLNRPPGVSDHYFREHLLLATLEEALAQADKAGGAGMSTRTMEMAQDEAMAAPPAASRGRGGLAAEGGAGGAAAQPIDLREDFRPLALFAPAVTTGDDGRASVDLELPDNLTRYRVMAVAVYGDDHFGKGESSMTARLPLMVRPSPPRFLNWGDRMEMPVVIQNQTDEATTVSVAVRAANLRFGEPYGRRFEVPAGDRVEVRFKAVTEEAGEAIVQVAASADQFADAAQHDFPVWTPATTEAFATYGSIDGDADTDALFQPVEAPDDSIAQFGGLEVTTSSTAVQELTDAVLYLVDYPFECSEQIASRVMGVAALKDVLEAFDAEGMPDEDELFETMGRDIDKLAKLQRSDGGFYLWSQRDHNRYPFVSVHVAHALERARQKGFSVPNAVLERAKKFLVNVEQYIPSTYSVQTKNAVRAYAYYVLDVMGESTHARARKLAGEEPGDQLSLEAIGWLMATLADDGGASSRLAELGRFVNNRASETAATAQFTTSYGGQEHVLLHSRRRTDAILLDALMATDPKSDLIPKLVRGLLDHRTRGRWTNTQENVFVLLALDRYFATYEKQTPDFVARMWLGDGYVGEHSYKGRTTERNRVEIPMNALLEQEEEAGDDAPDFVLEKDGKGRLYYRIGMRYAPTSLDLDPAEYGFSVERRYEAVDDDADVTRGSDGTWRIKSGARVRVVLSMVAPERRYHVALVDPLPAGLEPLNPALAVTEALPERQDAARQNPYWWWYRPWYVHQNLRDERAEAFAPLVRAGVHEYSYVTRATTPGEFVAPPAKAEEMYHPETFGRTGTGRVVVE